MPKNFASKMSFDEPSESDIFITFQSLISNGNTSVTFNSSIANSKSPPTPYDPEMPIYDNPETSFTEESPAYQPTTPCRLTALTSEDMVTEWEVKTEDDVWVRVEQKARDNATSSTKNESDRQHFNFLDEHQILSMTTNDEFKKLPRIKKIICVVKPAVDTASAYESTYPLVLHVPIDFQRFFVNFREGQSPIDRFALSCLRRRLRATKAAAKLFLTKYGLLRYDSYSTQFTMDAANRSKVPVTFAQEHPEKLGFTMRDEPVTLTVYCTLQATYAPVPDSVLDEVIQQLFQLDEEQFNSTRNELLDLLRVPTRPVPASAINETKSRKSKSSDSKHKTSFAMKRGLQKTPRFY